jgi:hypothetical protein
MTEQPTNEGSIRTVFGVLLGSGLTTHDRDGPINIFTATLTEAPSSCTRWSRRRGVGLIRFRGHVS